MKKITIILLTISLVAVFVLSSCPSGGGGGNTTFTINTPAKFTGTVTVEFQPGIPPAQMTSIRNKIEQAWNTPPLSAAADLSLDFINAVLNRNLKIIVENGIPYDGEDIRNWRSIAFHENYLLTAPVGYISDDISGALINYMHGMSP